MKTSTYDKIEKKLVQIDTNLQNVLCGLKPKKEYEYIPLIDLYYLKDFYYDLLREDFNRANIKFWNMDTIVRDFVPDIIVKDLEKELNLNKKEV